MIEIIIGVVVIDKIIIVYIVVIYSVCFIYMILIKCCNGIIDISLGIIVCCISLRGDS